jgi:hypothetical protein
VQASSESLAHSNIFEPVARKEKKKQRIENRFCFQTATNPEGLLPSNKSWIFAFLGGFSQPCWQKLLPSELPGAEG